MAAFIGFGNKVYFPLEFGDIDGLKRKEGLPGPCEYETRKGYKNITS